MQLTDHFTLNELTRSGTAQRLGIDNMPSDTEIAALKQVAENILEPVRTHYGVPFVPNSGFRCLELNRALKSKDTSQHVLGQAVDIEVPGIANFDLAEWIYNNLDYDQLILEFYQSGDPTSGWVHCSYIEGDRRNEVLTYSNHVFQNGLIG